MAKALKSNATLTEINLSGEDNRIHIKDIYQQFTLFLSLDTNRQQDWKKRCRGIK